MAIRKEGGSNPYAGKVMTTLGYRESRPPLCMVCGERRAGQLYSVNDNGQVSCADCMGPGYAAVLKGACDPETCACGERCDEPDPDAA